MHFSILHAERADKTLNNGYRPGSWFAVNNKRIITHYALLCSPLHNQRKSRKTYHRNIYLYADGLVSAFQRC